MAENGVWAGLFVGALLVGSAWHYTSDVKPKDEIGRYQVIRHSDSRIFLVDSSTGITWSWTHIMGNDGKQVREEWVKDGNDEIWTKYIGKKYE